MAKRPSCPELNAGKSSKLPKTSDENDKHPSSFGANSMSSFKSSVYNGYKDQIHNLSDSVRSAFTGGASSSFASSTSSGTTIGKSSTRAAIDDANNKWSKSLIMSQAEKSWNPNLEPIRPSIGNPFGTDPTSLKVNIHKHHPMAMPPKRVMHPAANAFMNYPGRSNRLQSVKSAHPEPSTASNSSLVSKPIVGALAKVGETIGLLPTTSNHGLSNSAPTQLPEAPDKAVDKKRKFPGQIPKQDDDPKSDQKEKKKKGN